MGKILKNGILYDNTIVVQLIGLCAVLGVSTTATNGFFMSIAVIFVLTLSNVFISLFRNFTPDKIRIPIFIVIIATFVTLVDMLLNAFVPDVHAQLGVFIPLIVVNCLILARAESFASKNGVFPSIVDGIGMGLGYTLAIMSMAIVRELIGSGTLFGLQILPESYPGIGAFVSAPGSFIILGVLIAVFRWILTAIEAKRAKAPAEKMAQVPTDSVSA